MFIFIDKYRNVWYNTRCDVQSGMSQQTETRRVVRVVEGAALEISAGSVNFVPSKTLANSGFSKFQIEYFYVFSPAFLSKRFCELKTGENIRRCTQAVEGSALENECPFWKLTSEKPLFYGVFRLSLKSKYPLVLSISSLLFPRCF